VQTTTQFDEDGALILYNLGVYGSCCVLFDSFAKGNIQEKAEVIDLSFAKGNIIQLLYSE
jgi:condensin complex subunit 2